ncbi:hypothetical protein V8F06_005018, partial [Rhypophila decipiens]
FHSCFLLLPSYNQLSSPTLQHSPNSPSLAFPSAHPQIKAHDSSSAFTSTPYLNNFPLSTCTAPGNSHLTNKMCVTIWETCPACECRASQPLYFQSSQCPWGGCPPHMQVEKELPAARSRWEAFSCKTEDCNFNSEHSSKLEAKYKSFGNLVRYFGAMSIEGNSCLTDQQPLPTSFPPPVIHPAYLASLSQPTSPTEGETPIDHSGSSPAGRRTPLAHPGWSGAAMSTPDLRRPRQERRRIAFTQPTQGERVKVQFRSMGPVKLSEMDPELADAIREKKKAMDQKIESQIVGKGVTPYLVEEDKLLQILRLNCFSFRQIHTDFMPRRTAPALIHRRNNQHKRHAKGFEYIPEDESMDTPAAEAGSSGTTGDEMEIDPLESNQREIETPGPDDDIYNASRITTPLVDDIYNATPPASTRLSVRETSPAEKAAQDETVQVKFEHQEPHLTTETQTEPAQPTETAEPSVKIE